MIHSVMTKNRFENFPNENKGKAIGRLCEVNRPVGYGPSALHYLHEPTLVKSHILRDNPEYLGKENMDRSEDSLRPIVKDRNFPCLPLLIRNQDKSPKRKRKGKPLLPPIEEVVVVRNPPRGRRNPDWWSEHRWAGVQSGEDPLHLPDDSPIL